MSLSLPQLRKKVEELQADYPKLRFLGTRDWPGVHVPPNMMAYIVHHVETEKRAQFVAPEDFKAKWFTPEKLQYFNDNGTLEGFNDDKTAV